MSISRLLMVCAMGLTSNAAFADSVVAPWSVSHAGERSAEAAAMSSGQVVQRYGFAPWSTSESRAPRGDELHRAVSSAPIGFHPWS
jgi:hypothetical protein